MGDNACDVMEHTEVTNAKVTSVTRMVGRLARNWCNDGCNSPLHKEDGPYV